MNKIVKKKWLKALKSGEYFKGKGALKRESNYPSYCCLGVLCELWGKGEWYQYEFALGRCGYKYKNVLFASFPPPQYTHAIHISRDDVGILANLNDENDDWSKVIKYIEKNL